MTWIKIRRFLLKLPIIGQLFLILLRLPLVFHYFGKPLLRFFKWLFVSKETTNFTYHLEPMNVAYLTSFLATVTGKSYQEVQLYVDEIQHDQDLIRHLEAVSAAGSENFKSDKEIRFGRRVGWYALVRINKPRVVIETGVEKGLGSCVIAAALKKNQEEGYPGRYYGTDINPKAGFLFGPPYNSFGEILSGDSIQSLKKLSVNSIDLFIND